MNTYERWERQWFALHADHCLHRLGDHGDKEAAQDTAFDLGLGECIIIDADEAAQWEAVITHVKKETQS